MSSSRRQPRPDSLHPNSVIEVKSKFEAEFRRFGLDRRKITSFLDFYNILESLHSLDSQFIITYPDKEGDLLPINNDDNFQKALTTALPLLRLIVQRKGEDVSEISNYASTLKRKKPTQMNPFTLISPNPKVKMHPKISLMEDFRQVSSIVDVDTVPETHRRVKLCKQNEDKPLGFYIRDGLSVRVTEAGLSKVPGIFISRLVPGGLAESTGLLSVNDEVLEVNGIEVAGKTLDQVTDMMIANSSNLIITVKPVNQMYTLSREQPGRISKMSTLSGASGASVGSSDSDEVKDVISSLALSPAGRQDDAREHCDGEEEDNDEEEDIVHDHVEELKVKAGKRLSAGAGSGAGSSSVGSADRRSVGSGKSFGSHRDSATNNRSRGGSVKSDASSSRVRRPAGPGDASPASSAETRRRNAANGDAGSGRSTPAVSNGGVLLPTRDGSLNNNRPKDTRFTSSIKSNKSDRSEGGRGDSGAILSL